MIYNLRRQKYRDTEADFQLYYTLAQDERVMHMISGHGLSLAEARQTYRQMMLSNQRHPACGFFKLIDAANDQYIGLGKLELGPQDPHIAEVGYMLYAELWGRGYGQAICDSMLDLASSLDIEWLFAIVDINNVASERILRKRGFEHHLFCEIEGRPNQILKRPQTIIRP